MRSTSSVVSPSRVCLGGAQADPLRQVWVSVGLEEDAIKHLFPHDRIAGKPVG